MRASTCSLRTRSTLPADLIGYWFLNRVEEYVEPIVLAEVVELCWTTVDTRAARLESEIDMTIAGSIEDDGLGILEGIRERVFEARYSTADHGTGL